MSLSLLAGVTIHGGGRALSYPSRWLGCAGSRGRRLLRPWCRTPLAGGAQMQYRSLCLTCLSNPRQGPACWGLPFSRSEIWGGALARCLPSSIVRNGDSDAPRRQPRYGRTAGRGENAPSGARADIVQPAPLAEGQDLVGV